MTTSGIAHLRIKLDDVEPAVVRRVEVPLSIRLDRLHLVLQAALGWTNSHLYEFSARGARWGEPDPDFDDSPLDAAKVTLDEVLSDTGVRSIKYLYDFGDGWAHSVGVVRVTEPEAGAVYPRLIEATGRCPPEDVGGPWGYGQFLTAIADPNHESHAEFIAWSGGGFDANAVNFEQLARAVAALGKRWSRVVVTARRKRSN